jgi:hypothetical protein
MAGRLLEWVARKLGVETIKSVEKPVRKEYLARKVGAQKQKQLARLHWMMEDAGASTRFCFKGRAPRAGGRAGGREGGREGRRSEDDLQARLLSTIAPVLSLSTADTRESHSG